MELELARLAERIEGHLAKLRCFSATVEGVTRLPFTVEARQAIDYLAEAMKQAGMTVRLDASGALIGRYEGQTAQTVVLGSHYDSVPRGGAFDGVAGVVCGLELVRELAVTGRRLPWSLEVVATNDEEGVRFGGGFFSSKAFLGLWQPAQLAAIHDGEGISLAAAMRGFGLEPEQIGQAVWDLTNIRCFIEIHCEQGPVLEQQQQEIGIVSGIVGMRRYAISLQGRPDHAGTTPMTMRTDALALAARLISKAEDTALAYPGAVATVGFCDIRPNVVNTIAGQVVCSLDIRSRWEADIQAMETEILGFIRKLARTRQAGCEVNRTLTVQPVELDRTLQGLLENSCRRRGYAFGHLPSGAGHDALQLATAVATAMVFVPSRQGRSHCPEEYSDSRHLAKAVLAVLDTLENLP